MVRGRMLSGVDRLDDINLIQNKVFVEELNIPADMGMDDAFCMHALALDEESKPCAIGKIMFDGDTFTISGVAVLAQYRRQKYGDFIVRLLVDKAIMSNASEMYSDVLEGTEKLFESIGFETCAQSYVKYGKTWIPMKLDVSNIHKCCNCH